ncbi:hypothetical protein HDU93_000484 [Gonapodya sp. JEL0774]|nr:hypothetical protein HDU93_000484 [Gonapodya sp. JEL0774]
MKIRDLVILVKMMADDTDLALAMATESARIDLTGTLGRSLPARTATILRHRAEIVISTRSRNGGIEVSERSVGTEARRAEEAKRANEEKRAAGAEMRSAVTPKKIMPRVGIVNGKMDIVGANMRMSKDRAGQANVLATVVAAEAPHETGTTEKGKSE